MVPEDAPSVRISPENESHGGKPPEYALCSAGGHVPGSSAGKT